MTGGQVSGHDMISFIPKTSADHLPFSASHCAYGTRQEHSRARYTGTLCMRRCGMGLFRICGGDRMTPDDVQVAPDSTSPCLADLWWGGVWGFLLRVWIYLVDLGWVIWSQ